MNPKVIAALEKRKFLLSNLKIKQSPVNVFGMLLPGPQGFYTALMASCRLGQFVSTELLIEQKAALNEKNCDGDTAINYAIGARSILCMKALIQAGADIHVRNNQGATPTHLAWQI